MSALRLASVLSLSLLPWLAGCASVWQLPEESSPSRRIGFRQPRHAADGDPADHVPDDIAKRGGAAVASKAPDPPLASVPNADSQSANRVSDTADPPPASQDGAAVAAAAAESAAAESSNTRSTTTARGTVAKPSAENATADALTDDEAANEQALKTAIEELESFGQLDPETKRQLIADLQATKPALWQPMLSIYRLALLNQRRNSQQNEALASSDLPGEQREVRTVAADSAEQPAAAVAVAVAHDDEPDQPPVRHAVATDMTDANQVASAATANDTLPSVDSPVRRASYEHVVRTATKSPASDRRLHDDHDPNAAWQLHLEDSIAALQSQFSGPARTSEEVRRQIELRLLRLAAGDRQGALAPIEGVSATQQEFWTETIYALATFVDTAAMPDAPTRAAEARRHLETAASRLGELSTLSVRNLAFCTKVNSFGIYEPFEKDQFAPGQQVLLYAELENFKCEETAEGFVTAVRSSYQIFDARGVRVESQDFAITEEVCRNRRRDFFMRYFIDLPTRIYDGEYTLKLTIEDIKGQTTGEATISFAVKEAK